MPEKNKKDNSIIKKYAVSVLIGIIVLFLSITICALINLKTPYPKDNSMFCALLSVAVASFISSFILVLRERKNGLISGLITGAILLVISFLMFTVSSSFSLNESSLLLIPASLVPASFSGIIAVNIKRK